MSAIQHSQGKRSFYLQLRLLGRVLGFVHSQSHVFCLRIQCKVSSQKDRELIFYVILCCYSTVSNLSILFQKKGSITPEWTKKVFSLSFRVLVQVMITRKKHFPPSHIHPCSRAEQRTWVHRQLWEAALSTDLIFVVSRGTVLASLLPGPLKYRDFPSLSTPQPVPTWPPVILYQRGLSFLSNLSNISLWLGTLDTQVPCDASRKKKREMLWWNCWTE